MKNLIKKLALVLAFALVITTIAPMANTSAASKTPGLVCSGKVLYLGGDFAGKYTDTYTFKFQNTYGLTATWKANNPSIAKMSTAKNTVVAVAPGTATFTVTLKNKAGKVVKTQTATVWVKQNADAVGFGSLKEVETTRNIGDSFRVYAFRGLNGKKYWTTTDYSVITDKIVWSSSDKEVATVDAKWGTVKVVGAGEATITAAVVQSNGVKTDLAASYKVTAASNIVSAKPLSDTTAEITFGSKVTQEVANALTLKNSKGVNITNYIKKVTLDTTGTKATVEVYVPFVNKEVYTFAIESLNTAIEMPVTFGDAASIQITGPATAVVGEATEIKYNVLDANGVVIEGKGTVEFTLSDYTYAYVSADNKITMYKEGASTTVNAVYKTGTYDSNWNEIVFKTSAVVTCVKAADVTITGELTSVVTDKTAPTAADFNGNMTVTLDDTNSALVVKATKSDKTVITSLDSNSKFTFETLDATKLFVNATTGKLVPIATGTVAIRVTNGNFVTIVNVNVVPAAKANSIALTASGTTVLSNASVGETVDFKLTVKDQYSNVMPSKAVTVDCVQFPTTNGATKADALKHVKTAADNFDGIVTFNAEGAEAGSYTYKLTTQDKTVYASVTVKAPAGDVVSYKVLLSKNTIDTTITDKTEASDLTATLTVVGVDANGLSKEIATNAVLEITSADGKTTVPVTGSNGVFTVNAVSENADGSVKKLAAGTYRITGTVGNRAIAASTFTVTDAQKAPVVEVGNTVFELKTTDSFDLAAELAKRITLGKDVNGCVINPLTADNYSTTFVSVEQVGTTHAVVKNVQVTETFENGMKVVHTVELNKVFSIIVK